MTTKAVAIEEIILDERCQPRAILNNEAVDEYAAIYKEEGELPALEVVDVGGDLLLINGFHRLAGARKADLGFIRVVVVEEADIGRAAWLAASMNQGCGVRRSNLDKRQAVMLALNSDVGQEQSLRVIADHVGVSHEFVRRMREEEVSTVDTPQEEAEPPSIPDGAMVPDPPKEDMYHTAARRIKGCYRKVCAILGENDDVCEALFKALEAAEQREWQ